MTTIRENYQLISAIALIVGVALITVAEAPSFHWTRIFGATAISLGALGIGVYVGLTQPGRYAAARMRLSAAKRPIGVVILLLLFLPVITGLVAGVVGPSGRSAGNRVGGRGRGSHPHADARRDRCGARRWPTRALQWIQC